MLNPESIRNASFSLMPTGYNPERVDTALNLIAERLVVGEGIADLVGEVTFEVADVGYAQAEVDHFFGQLRDGADLPVEHEEPATHEATTEQEITAEEQPADADDTVEQPATANANDETEVLDDAVAEADDEVRETAETTVVEVQAEGSGDEADAETDEWVDEADEADGVYVEGPREVHWQPPTAGVLDLDLLGEAIDRTAETLGSLRGFIDNEIIAMKLAVERQAQETAKRCEQLLYEASREAEALTESVNAEISRARKAAERQAEKQRRELAKELKQARVECDAEVAASRKEAEAYAAKVRADADRDRAEAQRTIENAIGMQASIAESLERARQQLTPSHSDDLAA